MQDTSAWQDVPANDTSWQDAPPPAAPRLPQEADTGFLAGAERGAEKFAQGAKGAVNFLRNAPSEGPIESAVSAVKGIPDTAKKVSGAIKGIPEMVDKADKYLQEDPAGFAGEALTSAVIPQLAGSAIFKGTSALTSAADEKVAELSGKMGFSEDARAAYMQSRAEAVKAHLGKVKTTAQKDLNQRAAQVIGTIDKDPGAISRTQVRSNMMEAFGDNPTAAPTEVSRIISAESGDNLTFGQLHDLNQKIFAAKMSAKGADKAALNEAYAKNAQLLSKTADVVGKGEEWNSALMDFRQFYKDWGKKSNLSKSVEADDYRQIMRPLDSPTTVQKLKRYKDADIGAIQTEQKAFRIAKAKGASLGWHGVSAPSMLEAAGGVGGGMLGASIGGMAGHPHWGAAVGAGMGMRMGSALQKSPFLLDRQLPSTLPPIE